MNDWTKDPDWAWIAQNAGHPQHHIGIDLYDNYFCRECSRDRIYILRRDEVDRLILVDRLL